MEWQRDGFTISTDVAAIDRTVVAAALAQSYWATDIPAETVSRSIDGSLCFSIRDAERQVGFARVISDGATVAYLGDVFVLPEFQGRGLGKWLVECVMAHPQLQGMRRWLLATADAHTLYEKFGFKPLARPAMFMELHNPNVYRKA
jgi:GNAT superfamily N-acetyltransferase